MRSLVAAAVAVFAAVSAGLGLAQAPAGPLVRAGVTQKVSDHVFVIPDDSAPGVPNVGIIVGTRAALVVDTGLGEPNGRTVLAEAQKVAPGKALYLVTTHIHPEHDLGAGAFPASTTFIRSNDQIAEIAEIGLTTANAFAGRSPAMAELLKGAQFRKADVTFDKEYALDLGGVTARLIALGANHTRGDTAIFVVGDAVLFAGDVAMKGGPNLASPASSVSHWQQSLNTLEALKPRLVVPSHGPNGEGATFMVGYRKFFTAIQAAAAAAKKRGESVEAAVQTVTAELAPQFPGAGPRMAGAIKVAYAEAR